MKKFIILLLSMLCALTLASCDLSALTGGLLGGGASDTAASDTAASEEVSQSESLEQGEHVHDLTRVSEREATCQKEGNITYWECECGKYFSDKDGETEISAEDITVEKTAHTATKTDGIEATCISKGKKAYWTCSVCAKIFADEACIEEISKADLSIPYANHTLTHHEEVPVVGKENGVMEHWTCSYCNGYFADAEASEKIKQADTVLYSVMNIPDFIVEVPEGRDPVVLQLSDTQIIDAGQAREGRTGVDYVFWATDQVEERCYDYVTEVVEATNPDLIIITGDVIYGEFDDNGSVWTSFINFMEGFQIPWAPVFGNHDNESKMGVDWQCEQLENAEYCLFEQKELTGNGNYSVAIVQGGEIKRVFYMLDSNGCGAASAESLANGHTTTTVGFGQDQINWYTSQIETLKKYVPDVKISFAYHIQQAIFAEAYAKYGFNQADKYQDINIDLLEDKAEGDFGYIGRQLKGPWDGNKSVYNGMKALGADSIFVGHEHCNSASVVYDGVRFQFGQKSSEYDRFNCIDANGVITGGYSKTGTSLMGGTVIVLSEEDATIEDAYIYYCDDDGSIITDGSINWSLWEKDDTPEAEITVNGLQYGGVNATTAEMYADGAVVAEAAVFDETTNAYKVTAVSQGKLYINTSLLKGKTTFTFSVYISETSTAKLSGYGEFAIRVKPNADEPSLDGKADGYIYYDSSASNDALKLEFGVWKTFTVDITGLDATCTEFAFVIATGNVFYLKDVVVS